MYEQNSVIKNIRTNNLLLIKNAETKIIINEDTNIADVILLVGSIIFYNYFLNPVKKHVLEKNIFYLKYPNIESKLPTE